MHGFGPIRVQQDGAASCLEDQVTTNNYSEHPSQLINQTHPLSESLKILNLFLKKTFICFLTKQTDFGKHHRYNDDDDDMHNQRYDDLKISK